jgi:hypothetical protein
MASRPTRSGSKTYDKDNIDNWTTTQLRDALKVKGINVPSSLTKTVLKSLYKENCASSENLTIQPGSETPPTQRSRSPVEKTVRSNMEDTSIGDCLKTLSSSMLAFTETVKMLGKEKSSAVPVERSNDQFPTLAEVYSTSPSTGTYNDAIGLDSVRHMATQHKNGVPANLLNNIDIVSDSLKQRIVDGRYVNLASLLIPDFEPKSKEQKEDFRLKKSLNMEQFRVAFGKYRRVMVMQWPHRQQELEAYETDIARIHSFYGEKFYDYHVAFASKAAEAVKLSIPVDWSRRDTELFQLILGGTRARQCLHCSSTLHETDFCEQSFRPNQSYRAETGPKQRFQPSKPRPQQSQKDSDKYGRKITYNQGAEVCNNFNGVNGCLRRTCERYHGCSYCMSQNHTRQACPTASKKSKPDSAQQPGNKA